MNDCNNLIERYKIYIYDRYHNLKKSGKKLNDFNNFDLAKIFEYYSCIKLTEEFNQTFYEYTDINPEFKEQHNLTKNDSGIDCCNLIDTIVQCKLREKTLSWKECSTFFGSNICIDNNKQLIAKWKKMIITRNKDIKLTNNLKHKQELFIDKTYDKQDIIKFCENLIINKPIIKKDKTIIRDYQKEAIKLIKDMKNNLIINLPTGTGKNFILAHALHPRKFNYLILVPRIILLEQIQTEIIKYNSDYKKYIQTIGDGNSKFCEDKKITICVYNSVKIIDKHVDKFDYIIIDEAHHIIMPEIYKIDNNSNNISENSVDNSDSDNSDSDNSDSDNSDNDNSDSDNSDSDNSDSDNSDNDDSTDNSDYKKYLKIIKSYQKYKNNIYLSATIDKLDGFDYYTKDLREMIDNKYLSDYIITIPIFTDDPSNKNICEYIIKNYQNIIIYCNSQKEGLQINNMMNSIQKNCSSYIDCETKKSERNKIIDKYKSGNIPFLINVKILIEGFDAPITKGICFMHMPSNKTTLIQIIGRALRLHENKTIANIILPFSSKSDEDNINNFLKIMARNDSRIRKSYINKKLGGYINIVVGDEQKNNDDNDDDIEIRYELIYDKMGVLQNSVEIFEKRLKEVIQYMDEHGKRPSAANKNRNKNRNIYLMGKWLTHQYQNYQNKQYNMLNAEIYKIWEKFMNDDKYRKHFLSNEDAWDYALNEVKMYMDTNNNNKPKMYKERICNNKNNNEKRLGQWLSTQQKSYKNKNYIMVHEHIRKKWETFINSDKYKKYFLSNEQIWEIKFNNVKKYFEENNKKPSNCDKNKEIKQLGLWINTQQINCRNCSDIMKNIIWRNRWIEFINDDRYKKYFLSNEEIWENTLNNVKKYMDDNNKKPSKCNKNKDIIYMYNWLLRQKENYNKRQSIMKELNIRKKWEDFINDNKYKQYLIY